MTRAVALVDGEHYPPVTAQAVAALASAGYQVVAAVFCGGGEKLSRPIQLEVPLIRDGDAAASLRRALTDFLPDAVVDLSDDPVVDHRTRMQLAAITLAHGARFEAPGLRMDPAPRPSITTVPTIAVIGTGKRCGKTAVSGHVARTLKAAGSNPVIVAMGRGGPERPVVVRGDIDPPDAARLLAVADAGDHAASDVYEDAVVAGVPVVGARRAGAGPGGGTAFDTVSQAIGEAERLGCGVVILEGSGTAIPPAAADATILVARDTDDPGEWPFAHRILLADLLVVRMPGEEVSPTLASALTSPNRDQASPIVFVTLRPTPMKPVEGRRVFVATTAPEAAGDAIRSYLHRQYGAEVTGISHHLADRARLVEDLSAAVGTYEVLACELKAAAVDVAVRSANQAGAEVVFLDNRPAGIGEDLDAAILAAARRAEERFARRRNG